MPETIRKPKPRDRSVQLFVTRDKNRGDSKSVPSAGELFAGTKPWACHGCHELMNGEAPVLLPSTRHGFSHDMYHSRCDPR